MDEYTYIKINNIKNETSTSSNGLKKIIEDSVIKILSTFIPKANPDFEHIIYNVSYWKIEFHNQEKAVWREIGFDKNDQLIVAMPDKRNYGFWSDNNLTLKDFKNLGSSIIEQEEFEKDWIDFNS
jgi:hypothetical protein